jgi:hypothetical protein
MAMLHDHTILNLNFRVRFDWRAVDPRDYDWYFGQLPKETGERAFFSKYFVLHSFPSRVGDNNTVLSGRRSLQRSICSWASRSARFSCAARRARAVMRRRSCFRSRRRCFLCISIMLPTSHTLSHMHVLVFQDGVRHILIQPGNEFEQRCIMTRFSTFRVFRFIIRSQRSICRRCARQQKLQFPLDSSRSEKLFQFDAKYVRRSVVCIRRDGNIFIFIFAAQFLVNDQIVVARILLPRRSVMVRHTIKIQYASET